MSEQPDAPTSHEVPTSDGAGVRRLPVRRAPRYGMFLLTGAVVGVVVALVVGLSGPVDPSTGRGALVGYLALLLGLLGGVVGGAVAVVLDWVYRRRQP